MSETKPTDEAKDEPVKAADPPPDPPADKPADAAHRAKAIDDAFGDVDPLKGNGKKQDDDDDSSGDVAGKDAEAKADTKADGDEEKEPDLLPRGNPMRYASLALVAGGAVRAFLLMAKNGQNWWGVPLGLVFVAIAAFGVMDLLGTFDDADEHVAARTDLGTDRARRSARRSRCSSLFCGFARARAGGDRTVVARLDHASPASFLGLVAAVFNLGKVLGPWKLDELGLERPLCQRHGFWVLAIGAFLYFPAMGLQSLWDPWETHYGEVAREILARDDWISLWWAQDGWFWSKPILNFWIQSLAMASLGTHYHADMMLTGAGGAWTRASRVGRAHAERPDDARARCTCSTRASRRSSGGARVCSARSCSRRWPTGSSSRTRR